MINRFPAYRQYESAFINANDAMMALLVSTQLTTEFLGEHIDRTALLPDLLERVPDAKRLNRTPKDAATILSKSESYFANMAVVYLKAIHQSFMDDVVKLLDSHGFSVIALDSEGNSMKPNSENIYEALERCLGGTLDGELLRLHFFMRRIRNRIVHYGGKPGDRLREECKNMTDAESEAWEALTGKRLDKVLSQDSIELSADDLMGALALSRRLVINVHDLLVARLDGETWANIIVRDYATENADRLKDPKRRLTHLRGYVKNRYSGVGISEHELGKAADLYISLSSRDV